MTAAETTESQPPGLRHRIMAGFIMRTFGVAVFGAFEDRYGCARAMQISVALMALPTLLLGLAAWPLYHWMLISGGSPTTVLAAHALLFLLLAVPLGSNPALFVELFPERDRLSGYSVAFNLGPGVFRGMTPMIAATLIATTGIVTAPAIYLTGAAAFAIVSLWLISDSRRNALR